MSGFNQEKKGGLRLLLPGNRSSSGGEKDSRGGEGGENQRNTISARIAMGPWTSCGGDEKGI